MILVSDMLQLVVVMRWRPPARVIDKLKHIGHESAFGNRKLEIES